jgi:ribosomal protein L11 methyltransferase
LPDELPEQDFDLVLANILANPLIELAAHLAALARPGGDLVLSGILEAQAEQVRVAYEPWFTFSPPLVQDGWVRLHGKKN